MQLDSPMNPWTVDALLRQWPWMAIVLVMLIVALTLALLLDRFWDRVFAASPRLQTLEEPPQWVTDMREERERRVFDAMKRQPAQSLEVDRALARISQHELRQIPGGQR